MNGKMRVAIGQMDCEVGDIDANLRTIRDFTERAKTAGAELVVFPEMADIGYSMPVIRELAKPWSEGAVPELRRFARELSMAIICGVAEREGGSIFNSQVCVDARGEIIASYRKTHLFSCEPVSEADCFAPGDALASVELNGFRAGLTICYDLRFPELYRRLATEKQTNVFVISSAWPFPRVEHLRVLATARAIENQSYVVLSNRVGHDERVTTCGSSAVIDPYGVVIAAGSADREELIVADLHVDLVNVVRSRMPVFEHRRAEVYASCATPSRSYRPTTGFSLSRRRLPPP